MGENAEAALRDWLLLAQLPGIGPRSFRTLLEHFGTPSQALAADPQLLKALGIRKRAIARLNDPPWDQVEAALDWAQGEQAHILTLADPAYPVPLAELPDAPPVLYLHGNPQVLKEPQLAIVGSRNPSRNAWDTTKAFARHLAACGLTITSGLALGIDSAAHEGALEAGYTIAVLATGPDRVYPAQNQALARRIADQGALVSEFPPGTPPRAEHFPRRNRIISALSLGTFVTEAALRSGSLITARYAVEQGREVFAMPGSIHNPLARGCHALIKSGAKLVESTDDILQELSPQLHPFVQAGADDSERKEAMVVPSFSSRVDARYHHLIHAMGQDPISLEGLIQRTGMSANEVASVLTLLELEGIIVSVPGGRYAVCAS